MKKQISKLEISKKSDLSESKSLTSNEDLNEDLLSSQELSDVEGGWCDYTCVACASGIW